MCCFIIIFFGCLCIEIRFLYFLFVLNYSHLTPFWDYLFNSVHYLFIEKDAFAEEYGLVKEKACYFTYDRSTKRIINKQKYFMIPGLFINDYHSLTYNIFAFIFYLINIFNIIVCGLGILFKKTEPLLYEELWKSFRILILIIFFTRLISLIELTFLHVLGENNPFHQLKVFYFNSIKSLPLIKDFYYYFDNKHFQKQTATKLVKWLSSSNWFIYGLPIVIIISIIAIGLGIDYLIWRIIRNKKNDQDKDIENGGIENKDIENKDIKDKGQENKDYFLTYHKEDENYYFGEGNKAYFLWYSGEEKDTDKKDADKKDIDKKDIELLSN